MNEYGPSGSVGIEEKTTHNTAAYKTASTAVDTLDIMPISWNYSFGKLKNGE